MKLKKLLIMQKVKKKILKKKMLKLCKSFCTFTKIKDSGCKALDNTKQLIYGLKS